MTFKICPPTRRLVFALAFGVALAPTAGPAENMGWRLPVLAKPETGNTATGGSGWALPVAAKSVSDALGARVDLPADRPVKRLFDGPSLILTGFSGHTYGRPVLAEEQRAAARLKPEYQIIDLDGAVVTLSDIDGYGHAMNGDEVTRPAEDKLYARLIGQVFGAVLDDATAPNLYLAASSAYGLQIVGPDANGDRLPDRLKTGQAEARWMEGQWGQDPLAGPGTIWRVDGQTGQVAIFANLADGARENSGAGLGNLAYDEGHDHIFASDLATGLISRLDLRGVVVETFDHGTVARSAMGLSLVAHDPDGRVDITDPRFDAAAPESWGFAPPERRVWGLTVAEGRLYYAVAAGIEARPEVWSVGLDHETGAFLTDPRWELSLAKALPGFEISDMGFAPDGAMVLAQRGPRTPKEDFSEVAQVGEAQVLRFVRETPKDDPLTPSVWVAEPQVYRVGFAGQENNTTGGIAFGPSYDAEGFLDYDQCRGTLWTTGEALRDAPDLATRLMPGGQMRVAGAMAQPAALPGDENAPPWFSYAHDRDGVYPERAQTGFAGDVAVLGCDGAQLAASGGATRGGGEGGTDWLACVRDPAACVPRPKACATNVVTLECDTTTGTYVARISQTPRFTAGFDRVKMTDPSGKITSLPAMAAVPGTLAVPLTGLGAGQVGQISLCSFETNQTADGQPHDCCNSTVEFKLPAKACEKEIQ